MDASRSSELDQIPATLTLPPQRETLAKQSDRNFLRKFLAIGTAAAVMFVLVPNLLRPGTPPTHAGEFSQELTKVPGGVLHLINQAVDASQSRLPEISPLANLSMPALLDWQSMSIDLETPVQQEVDVWQRGWNHLQSRFGNETREL